MGRRALALLAGSRGGVIRYPRPPVPGGPYLVLGLGEAGIAAVKALSRHAGTPSVLAWDERPTPWSKRIAAALEAAGGRAELGRWEECAIAREPWRCAIKSPGIAFDAAPLREAARRGVPVLDEAELAWRCATWRTLAVTGTNGKTTVCKLVHAALLATGTAAVRGGNTEDAPALSALDPATPFVVAELSSYQLEGCEALRGDVAVLTNLSRDHLDRHGTLEEYARVKRRLFVRTGTAAPVSVLNLDDPLGRELAGEAAAVGGRVVGFGSDRTAHVRLESATWDVHRSRIRLTVGGSRVDLTTRLPGMHNACNVAAALA